MITFRENKLKDMFFEEVKEDFKYIRRRTECLERKLEPLFDDLHRMSQIIDAIQNHSDCTEDMFAMIEEELKDYAE
jgi:hypothetical protein